MEDKEKYLYVIEKLTTEVASNKVHIAELEYNIAVLERQIRILEHNPDKEETAEQCFLEPVYYTWVPLFFQFAKFTQGSMKTNKI